jgi:hypothetical protein
LRHRLAGGFRRDVFQAASPRRQRRDHRVAFHRVGCGRSNLGLRIGDVVHHVAAHHAKAIVVVPA